MISAAFFDRWEALSQEAGTFLAPITSEQGVQAVKQALDEVSDRMETPEDVRYIGLFRYLAAALKVWEDQHEPIPDAAPHVMLSYYMDQRGLSLSEFARATGIRKANLSKLVRGERELSLKNIRAISEHLSVNSLVFL